MGEPVQRPPGGAAPAAPARWLAGRLVVVTGASRGIGAATAAALASAGAHVVLAARDGQALDGVAGRIKDAGGQATPVPTDVSDETAVRRLFAAAAGLGQLGALVCAAGVLTPAPFAGTTSALWHETLGVNLTGTFLCCRAAFTAMAAAGQGRIINIASLSGVYATEKFPGLAAAEAQACGTPVVAFRRGALGEVIADGVTGFLVPADDIRAAATAVSEAARLSRPACREHAEGQLDLEVSLDAHERLYRRVAGG